MELVFLVLDNMRLDNQVVSFSALKLVESVFVNCISELTLYVNKAVQQLGFPVGHYIKLSLTSMYNPSLWSKVTMRSNMTNPSSS